MKKRIAAGGAVFLALSIGLTLLTAEPRYNGTATVQSLEVKTGLTMAGKTPMVYTDWLVYLCPSGEEPVTETDGECFEHEVSEDTYAQLSVGQVVRFTDGSIQ